MSYSFIHLYWQTVAGTPLLSIGIMAYVGLFVGLHKVFINNTLFYIDFLII